MKRKMLPTLRVGNRLKVLLPRAGIKPARHCNNQMAGTDETTVPRFGSTNTVGLLPLPLKLNMPMMLPAVASKEPPPIR